MNRAIIVVPATRAAAANKLGGEVDPNGREDIFTSPLVAVGTSGPITHYWCGWSLTDDQWTRLRARLDIAAQRTAGVRFYNATSRTPEQILAELNLTPKPAPIG